MFECFLYYIILDFEYVQNLGLVVRRGQLRRLIPQTTIFSTIQADLAVE